MSTKTSDFFVQRLKAWGVTRIYGYPGDGINGVLGAIQRANEQGDGIRGQKGYADQSHQFRSCTINSKHLGIVHLSTSK